MKFFTILAFFAAFAFAQSIGDCESSSECGESEYCMENELFGEVVSKNCQGTSLTIISAIAHAAGWSLWRPLSLICHKFFT